MAKKKSELDKLIKKYQPAIKKTGEQLTKAVKIAEEDIAKMYKVAQTHIEIQMTNLKKERLYHEIGKLVARKLVKGELSDSGLEKYKKKLDVLDAEGEKKKTLLSRAAQASKKKK